jgi:hypothetical protein
LGPGDDLVPRYGSDDATRVQRCDWPAGLTEDSFDTTVVPFMQGMLLPKTWPEKTWLYDTLSFGRGLYQPWWGHEQAKAALLVLLETPDDGGCHFEHPAGGPTRIGPQWVHSLGRGAYPRRARLCFLDRELRGPGQTLTTRPRPASCRCARRSPAVHGSRV